MVWISFRVIQEGDLAIKARSSDILALRNTVFVEFLFLAFNLWREQGDIIVTS